MFSAKAKEKFPLTVAILLLLVSTLSFPFDLARVHPELAENFSQGRIVISLLVLISCVMLAFEPINDFKLGFFMVVTVSFSVFGSWFLPLFEIGYFQCAVASAFFKPRRRWLYPLIYGAGLVAYFLTYYVQDVLRWTIPPAERVDWVILMISSFVIGSLVREYAIGNTRREQDRFRRYSMIGVEAVRLIHDIKGLLATPVLIADVLRSPSSKLSAKEVESNLNELGNTLGFVRQQLQKINLLVAQPGPSERIDVRHCCESIVQLLFRRASYVQITLPEQKFITGSSEVFQSVLFNLLVNCLEAFERNGTRKAQIDIFWEVSRLVIRDNAGLPPNETAHSHKGLNSGLGLELVRHDLSSMNATLAMKRTPYGTEASMDLRRSMVGGIQ